MHTVPAREAPARTAARQPSGGLLILAGAAAFAAMMACYVAYIRPIRRTAG